MFRETMLGNVFGKPVFAPEDGDGDGGAVDTGDGGGDVSADGGTVTEAPLAAETTETVEATETTEDTGEQTENEKWWQSVADSHVPTASKYKTLDDQLAAHTELRTKLNDALFIPGKDASDEDREKFFKRLGRPAKPEGYREPQLEGVEWEDGLINEFRSTAYEAGLSQGQFEKLLSSQAAAEVETRKAAAKAHADAHAGLEKEWGDSTEANYELAKRTVISRVFPDEKLRASLGITGDDPKQWHPAVVKAFAQVAPMFADDKFHGRTERDVGKSESALQEELKELLAKPDYWVQGSSSQKRATEINEALYGTAPIH